MVDSHFKKEYLSRIYAVQNYIESNLINSFSLDELANVAGFSKYHFHRIFKSIVHENLFEYIDRIRIERVASFLLQNPEESLSDIAFKFGFTDSAMFSHSFRKRYGITASTYRKRNHSNCRMNSNESKSFEITSDYAKDMSNTMGKEDVTMKVSGNVELVAIDDMHLVYVRHSGTCEELSAVFQSTTHKLKNFALATNLMNKPETKLLTIYYDNPEIASEEKLRTNVCMVVPEDVKGDDEILNMVIPSRKYAIGHFEINADEYSAAWKYLYGEWLFDSGFQPDDGVSFEMYIDDAHNHPEKKHLIDIYLPIKPL